MHVEMGLALLIVPTKVIYSSPDSGQSLSSALRSPKQTPVASNPRKWEIGYQLLGLDGEAWRVGAQKLLEK